MNIDRSEHDRLSRFVVLPDEGLFECALVEEDEEHDPSVAVEIIGVRETVEGAMVEPDPRQSRLGLDFKFGGAHEAK